MLHYAINRPVGTVRGESDLSPLLRWLSTVCDLAGRPGTAEPVSQFLSVCGQRAPGRAKRNGWPTDRS